MEFFETFWANSSGGLEGSQTFFWIKKKRIFHLVSSLFCFIEGLETFFKKKKTSFLHLSLHLVFPLSLSSFSVSLCLLSLSLSLSVSLSLYLRVVSWSFCCVVLCLVLWCVWYK